MLGRANVFWHSRSHRGSEADACLRLEGRPNGGAVAFVAVTRGRAKELDAVQLCLKIRPVWIEYGASALQQAMDGSQKHAMLTIGDWTCFASTRAAQQTRIALFCVAGEQTAEGLRPITC
jgi:hypothetical protein